MCLPAHGVDALGTAALQASWQRRPSPPREGAAAPVAAGRKASEETASGSGPRKPMRPVPGARSSRPSAPGRPGGGRWDASRAKAHVAQAHPCAPAPAVGPNAPRPTLSARIPALPVPAGHRPDPSLDPDGVPVLNTLVKEDLLAGAQSLWISWRATRVPEGQTSWPGDKTELSVPKLDAFAASWFVGSSACSRELPREISSLHRLRLAPQLAPRRRRLSCPPTLARVVASPGLVSRQFVHQDSAGPSLKSTPLKPSSYGPSRLLEPSDPLELASTDRGPRRLERARPIHPVEIPFPGVRRGGFCSALAIPERSLSFS